MAKYNYDENGLAIVFDRDMCKDYLIDRAKRRVSDCYTHIEKCGEGYYMAEQGAKKNILRPDGSVVLKEWHNDVFDVKCGLFIFSNTIRKSKNNPKTRYTYGVAHVSGDVIFPMIFDCAHWSDNEDSIYAEIGEKPYIITIDGSIHDMARSHLPQKKKVDFKQLLEKIVNWTLPGLQFFYRDTNAPVDVNATYHVGDILRAGSFIDVTTMLQKPAHKIRFLIASAHTANLFEVEDLCLDNPDVKRWNLCTLHFNSYFKVMDVYEKEGVTQVFLLHIPPAAVFYLGKGESVMNLIYEATGQETSLVEMARKSLDSKLKQKVHPRSLDPVFCDRMSHPVGLDNEFNLMPLDPLGDEAVDDRIASIGSMVHLLAEDADINGFIEVEDNFPYTGVEGSVCEGCVYAGDIHGKGECCGRLLEKDFRNRYLKGRCEYRKVEISRLSEFEEMDQYRKEKAKEKEEKSSDVYALRLVKDFVNEKLGGDIDKLRDLDLETIRGDEKYYKSYLVESELVKSIMALVFKDSWPGLSVDSINNYAYRAGKMMNDQNLLGCNVCDKYFKGMQGFNPSKELFERALRVTHMLDSIGNLWILPNKWSEKESMVGYKDTYKFHGYMDKYLQAMHAVFTKEEKRDFNLCGIFYKNRKVMTEYQGADGWIRFADNMMLRDFMDESGKPREIFDYVWVGMKGLDRERYLEAVDKFCAFCEETIPKRAEQIISVLKTVI